MTVISLICTCKRPKGLSVSSKLVYQAVAFIKKALYDIKIVKPEYQLHSDYTTKAARKLAVRKLIGINGSLPLDSSHKELGHYFIKKKIITKVKFLRLVSRTNSKKKIMRKIQGLVNKSSFNIYNNTFYKLNKNFDYSSFWYKYYSSDTDLIDELHLQRISDVNFD